MEGLGKLIKNDIIFIMKMFVILFFGLYYGDWINLLGGVLNLNYVSVWEIVNVKI